VPVRVHERLQRLPSRRNRHIQAFWSALWPGLGQLVAGRRVGGLLLAIPPLALLVLAIAAIAAPDRLGRLAQLLDPAVIAALLIVEVALLAWRVVAVTDALVRGEGRVGSRAAALSVVGALFVLVPSLYLAYLTEVAREAASTIFATVEAPYHPPVNPLMGRDEDGLLGPGVAVSPPPELGRFTVLLIGVDSGAGRNTFLTDTMIVASLDPIANAVSMISLPRDTVDLPLPDGSVFRGKINSLVAYVRSHPSRFPGAPSGEAVLAATLGQLLGVQVDGWAEVNLPGFVRVVNALGGIDVYVRDGFCDAGYNEYGINGFAITPGRYHFDGDEALGYARIRHALGESDFTRAGRQQELIVAARDRVVGGGFLHDPAGFIEAMGQLVKTSVAPSALAQYVDGASEITRDHVYRQVIQHPLVRGTLEAIRGSIQIPDLPAIHALGVQAFPPAGTLPVGLETIPDDPGGKTRSTLPKATCFVPAPTPAPTPQPTDTPIPSATPEPSPSDKPGGGPPDPSPLPSDSPPPGP
jgi:polyisoprenyl-teichoic acid--peptidoglycan teichoic acid transferase